jgi:hypothetical protein
VDWRCRFAEELIALKVLSLSSRRPQDQLDLDGLLRVNSGADLERVRALLDLVTARGFHRGEQLQSKLDAVLTRMNE